MLLRGTHLTYKGFFISLIKTLNVELQSHCSSCYNNAYDVSCPAPTVLCWGHRITELPPAVTSCQLRNMAVWHHTALQSWTNPTTKQAVVAWSVENCFCNRTSWKQALCGPWQTQMGLRGQSLLSTKPFMSRGDHTFSWATRAHRSRKALAGNPQLKILSLTHYPMLYLKAKGERGWGCSL